MYILSRRKSKNRYTTLRRYKNNVFDPDMEFALFELRNNKNLDVRKRTNKTLNTDEGRKAVADPIESGSRHYLSDK